MYRLSNKSNNHNTVDQNHLDLGKLSAVFIIFGLLSLLTSYIYSMETKKVVNTSFRPNSSGSVAEIGPINVTKYNEVYSIKINASMPVQSWSFIEGKVLNSKKEYLFSFGKEFWHEQGRDSDGAWREMDDSYSMNVTFPSPQNYYLQFASESNRLPDNIVVKIVKKRGSSIPHLWFGIIMLIVGIIMNEIKNRTFKNILDDYISD